MRNERGDKLEWAHMRGMIIGNTFGVNNIRESWLHGAAQPKKALIKLATSSLIKDSEMTN